MAGMAHAGIALAAKPLFRKVNLGWLILLSFGLDLVWSVFLLLGLESLPGNATTGFNGYSHSLAGALVWSLLCSGVIYLYHRQATLALGLGGIFFAHWMLDLISHPMTGVLPGATPLPWYPGSKGGLGIGLWDTLGHAVLGECLVLILGLAIYLWDRRRTSLREKP